MSAAETPAALQIVTTSSPRWVADTVARLIELVDAEAMRPFAVIDQRAGAHRVGLELRETTPVMFGSPPAGTPVMAAAPCGALDLPLKVLVWDDGHRTKVSYAPPNTLAARHQLAPRLAAPRSGSDALTDGLVAGPSRSRSPASPRWATRR